MENNPSEDVSNSSNQMRAPEYMKNLEGSGTALDPWRFTNPEGVSYIYDIAMQQWVVQQSEAALIAQQQAIYGKDEKEKEKKKKEEELEKERKKKEEANDPAKVAEAELKRKKKEEKKRKKKEGWAKKAKNQNVYVSGLPLDMGEEELGRFMSKCGVLKKDPETAIPKVKIYRNEDGSSKGDGLVGYFRQESVDLALKILDGGEIKPGFPIKVVQAEFQPKQDFVKKKKAPSKKVKRYNQAKELSWDEEGHCHVILKHMFTPQEAESDPNFYQDLENEITEEVEKIGEIEKVKVFERNPEGVVAVKFMDSSSAALCIEKMNGRFFAGRKLEADYYDGFTNYTVKESDEMEEKRIESFGDWLENE